MAQTKELKVENTQLIRNCFLNGQVWTKNALASKTGLSLAGVTNVLQELQLTSEIIYIGEADSTGGRKSKNYLLNKDYTHLGLIVMKKVDGQEVMVGEVRNLFNELLSEVSISSGKLEALDNLITQLQQDDKVKQVVISLPGICSSGYVDVCDFTTFEGMNLKDYLEGKHNIHVIIENDVNVACIGLSEEYPEVKHLAFIYQPASDYVGCGMIINHQLHNGFSHFAGELRYLPFYDHEVQDELLKEYPQDLLKNQLLTLLCVMNPELIGYCSDVFEDELVINPSFAYRHMAKLVRIHNLEELSKKGLFNIGIRNL